jgi:hypothetical protein
MALSPRIRKPTGWRAKSPSSPASLTERCVMALAERLSASAQARRAKGLPSASTSWRRSAASDLTPAAGTRSSADEYGVPR